MRMKCAHTRQGINAVEFLYAYRLNFVALRNQSLLNINREPPYPLPFLDPTQPMREEAPAVTFNPTKVTFWKYKANEAGTLSLEDIGTMSSGDIHKAIIRVKLSCFKEDKYILKTLMDMYKLKKIKETMHDTSHGHPSRIIIPFEGMDLKLPFKRAKVMKRMRSLEKLKQRL